MHVIRARKWVDCNYALATCSGTMHLGFITDIYPRVKLKSIIFSHVFHPQKTLHWHHTFYTPAWATQRLDFLPNTHFHMFKSYFQFTSKSLKLVSFSADPVYSFFFTVSPYLKSLSMVAANKLLHLLEVRACQFCFSLQGLFGLGNWSWISKDTLLFVLWKWKWKRYR